MIEGSCLCGAVRIAVETAPDQVTECNCSACHRLGTLWAYYRPAQVRVEGATVTYQRGRHNLFFHHCGVCGCTTHWSPAHPGLERMGVNARLMPPDILAAAQRHQFDGAEKL